MLARLRLETIDGERVKGTESEGVTVDDHEGRLLSVIRHVPSLQG